MEFKALVYDLLGLDPAALAKMDVETNSIAAGLNLLVRQMLQRAIERISATNEAAFRLCNSVSAKALNQDEAMCDLSTLFEFALVSVARTVRGLSHIPLCPATEVIDLDPHRGGSVWTASECAAVAVTLLKDDILKARDLSGPGVAQSMSICDLVKRQLGLIPKDLVRPLYATQREANRAFARDPEGQVIVGLAAFLVRMIGMFQAAAAQNVDSIRLLIWDRTVGRESLVRLSNISTLLAAALLAEEGRNIAFLVQSSAPAHSSALH
ncbi:MAG: hypothetical protein OTI36_08515 [Beijerinckiaceae bacterium]|nr:hypothetical protein [Beijerinckiaceae bacterium]